MKNLATIILICISSLKGFAQISSAYRTQVETIFQVNRSFVTTGLLQDYGILFSNVSKYTGIRSDSSYLDYAEWQSVYNSIYTCRFNATATLTDPATAFNQIATVANQNTNAIVFVGLHYRYERFKSNAVSSNLVYISNNKIYDRAGRPTTPYEIKEAFAMVQLRTVFNGANHNFLFKPQLFYSNTGKTISNLKVDFNDGAGYRTVTANVPLPITYITEGEKKLIFKITYTDGSVVESHTKIVVKDIPAQQAQARYVGVDTSQFYFPKAGFTTKAYNGSRGGALVTVEYANPGKTIRKPLIILSGLDGWKIRSPEDPSKNWSFRDIIATGKPTKNGNLSRRISTTTFQTLSDTLQTDGYDLIFVDYDNGTDYIQRNAYVLESVIQWVNAVKQPYNGVRQKNVIMGFSMGGLVIRYALRDMEKAVPAITHEVRLNVSFDSPHQGSNIPIGFQAATLHLAGSGVLVGIPGGGAVTLPFGLVFSDLGRAALLANAPASRQLLRYLWVLEMPFKSITRSSILL